MVKKLNKSFTSANQCLTLLFQAANMALHTTFTIPAKYCWGQAPALVSLPWKGRYAVNFHEFQTVTASPEVPCEILDQLLTITEAELYENINCSDADLLTWLRYKAMTLRKILAAPGNFTFLKLLI